MGTAAMGTFLQDALYSHRFLRNRPVFTIAAALTLALGIGATTAVFSAMHGLLLRPLPFDEPGRVVVVRQANTGRGLGFSECSTRMFAELQMQSDVFTHVTAVYGRDANIEGPEEPLQVQAWQVTGDFFGSFGVRPAHGRGLRPDETRIGDPRPVVVLGHDLWRTALGADPSAVGRQIRLDDESVTIVGVMPATEQWLDEVDLFVPLPRYVTDTPDRRILMVVGRLRSGQTLETARAQLQEIAARVHPEYAVAGADFAVQVRPFDEVVVDPRARRVVRLLGAAVLFVLLIACANLANLLLARAVGRQREIAVHTALGAGRVRLVRRLLTESIMIAALGAGLGMLMAVWGIDALRPFLAAHVPRLDTVGLHRATFAFVACLALVAGAAAGMVPAIVASRASIGESLKEAGPALGGPRGQGVRGALVVIEVALALALLIAAGLLLRSALRASRVDPGFQTDGRLAITVNLPRSRYEPDILPIEFWRRLLERVRELPGVESAMGTSDRWLFGTRSVEFEAEGDAGQPPRVPIAGLRTVTPGYFKTMGIPILAGREFTDGDWAAIDGTAKGGAPFVAMVSETLARRQWPGKNPIGRRIRPVVANERIWVTVIGVVADAHEAALTEPPRPIVFLSEYQYAWTRLYLVVHAEGDPASVLPGIRQAVAALDATVPTSEIVSLDALRRDSLYVGRAITLLVVIFAAVAVSLAAIGVYGLVAYSVAGRTHEFGVRIALGARPADLVRLVMAQGLKLAVAGEAAGLYLAFVFGVTLRTLLFEVSPVDPLTYVGVGACLLVVAAMACLVPAWRAAHVDPVAALRTE